MVEHSYEPDRFRVFTMSRSVYSHRQQYRNPCEVRGFVVWRDIDARLLITLAWVIHSVTGDA